MAEFLSDVVLDCVIDSLKLFPFLFLTYLLMEMIEHKTDGRFEKAISKAGRLGPLFGSLLGALPQCGFSAAAAGLYSGRLITVGTLIAIFLATSDEMLLVMLSSAVRQNTGWILPLKLIAVKVVCAMLAGFITDLAVGFARKKRPIAKATEAEEICEMCEHDRCHCEKHGVFLSALIHSGKILVFIAAVMFAVGTAIFILEQNGIDKERIGGFIKGLPVLGEFITGLIGLIPNCAASVVLTELYAEGVINAGQALSGLFAGAGVGVLILFRTNRGKIRENLLILLTLYLTGVGFGLLFNLTGLSGLLGL